VQFSTRSIRTRPIDISQAGVDSLEGSKQV
jgi:hypothetical protein